MYHLCLFSPFLLSLLHLPPGLPLFLSVLELSGIRMLIAVYGKFAHHFRWYELFIVVTVIVFTPFTFKLFVAPIGVLLNLPCLPEPHIFSWLGTGCCCLFIDNSVQQDHVPGRLQGHGLPGNWPSASHSSTAQHSPHPAVWSGVAVGQGGFSQGWSSHSWALTEWSEPTPAHT